mmetsp:Transcript_11114/g.20630  ORF Transcript_11114/g.20630 Transcript_11114/m.20630 type:complete len:202 (-) Transcript_11114:569-1174(-)
MYERFCCCSIKGSAKICLVSGNGEMSPGEPAVVFTTLLFFVFFRDFADRGRPFFLVATLCEGTSLLTEFFLSLICSMLSFKRFASCCFFSSSNLFLVSFSSLNFSRSVARFAVRCASNCLARSSFCFLRIRFLSFRDFFSFSTCVFITASLGVFTDTNFFLGPTVGLLGPSTAATTRLRTFVECGFWGFRFGLSGAFTLFL